MGSANGFGEAGFKLRANLLTWSTCTYVQIGMGRKEERARLYDLHAVDSHHFALYRHGKMTPIKSLLTCKYFVSFIYFYFIGMRGWL
jgi:hypothetical protein